MEHIETGEKLFEVFDPVNDISPVCTQITSDQRLLAMVESIMGEPSCLFKAKLIFKPPGALGYNLHQDVPRYWAGFPRSFLTVLIPIDRSTEENGCTEVFSGYHHEFLSPADRPDLYMLPNDCVDPARRVNLVLNPGDVAIFHGLTPHRSAPNRSREMRRVFYVSYNARSEGGDQRERHYREFQERMRTHLSAQSDCVPYFR
jgi:ectoine hydroxylase-related dioxygenase (phytanoyl-CoA dioxygenase family)